MFTPQVVDLAYIGNRPTKTDNVCGTGTVWIGFGDIQKVERKHIPVFLKHPDVWMLGDKFKGLHGISEPLTGEQQNDLGSIGSALVEGAPLVPVQSLGGELQTESAPAIVNIQSGLADAPIIPSASEPGAESENNSTGENSEDGKSEKADEEKSEKTGEQLAVIKNAILSLEQGNPKHFSTTNGVPVVSAVRNAAGDENITAAEVRAAWSELNGKAE